MRDWIRPVALALWLAPAIALAQSTGGGTPAPAAEEDAEPARVLCPVTGNPVDRGCVVRFRGRWVYFADDQARKTFEEDPYAYVEGMQRQWEANRPLRIQVRCPVTGEVPAEDVYVGKGDEAVLFANEEAKRRFLAAPDKFRERLEECYTYQTLCAHSGMPINPRMSLRLQGETLYFMCPNCRGAFEKEPAKTQRDMAAKARRLARENERKWITRQLDRTRAALRDEPAEAETLRVEIERLEQRLAGLRAEADTARRE